MKADYKPIPLKKARSITRKTWRRCKITNELRAHLSNDRAIAEMVNARVAFATMFVPSKKMVGAYDELSEEARKSLCENLDSACNYFHMLAILTEEALTRFRAAQTIHELEERKAA